METDDDMPELIEILIKKIEKEFPQPKPIEYEEIGYPTWFLDERRCFSGSISGAQSKSGFKYVKRQNQSKIKKFD